MMTPDGRVLLMSDVILPGAKLDISTHSHVLTPNITVNGVTNAFPYKSNFDIHTYYTGSHTASDEDDREVPVQAYRGISFSRKRTPLGPYRRPMPRVLGGS